MSSRLRTALLALTVIAMMAVGLTPAPATTLPLNRTDVFDAFAPQLITVHTPTRADKDRLNSMGLDLTEHAGHDYIEMVAYSQDELDLLAGEGFTWDVRIPDLLARQVERIQLDLAFAEANPVTAIPSGRNAYRVLADFGAEIDQLVADNPTDAVRISIGESVEGRELTGIEIGIGIADADNTPLPEDGRPVFLMFGAHHAREWPSAEAPMEFAHDLLGALNDPLHPDHDRTVAMLSAGRVIIVPVSNPDGYDASRTTGDIIDLNVLGDDNGPLYNPGILVGTPGNAYKRKNCRYIDGQSQPAGTCVVVPSPGGFGTGIDLNRNYGALWGGPGADDVVASATYHGPAPFSEPETQAIRDLISTRQVTQVLTNHTFSNLLLRPVGLQPSTIYPDGHPAGFAPDECFRTADGRGYGMQELGERMTAQTGYSNQFGWELYDTTGTTEDYSYNATGGYGYTFEIGPDEFHPPFEKVIDEYLGTTPAALDVAEGIEDPASLTTAAAADCGTEVDHDVVGGGLREAYFIALENAVNPDTHSVVTGTAPAGETLTLQRAGTFPLWDGTQVPDVVATTIQVGTDGTFEWHTNPSTRPFVDSRMAPILSEAVDTLATSGVAPSSAHAVPSDNPFEVTEDVDLLVATVSGTVSASGVAADLNEHYVKLLDPSGQQVASAEGFGATNSLSWTGPDGAGVPAGTYTLRVDNYLNPGAYDLTASTFNIIGDATPGATESWTLTCGESAPVTFTVARGESVDLGAVCG